IEADRYPYIASNTGLQVLLPDWAFDGGRDAIVERLKDPETRKRFREEILANHPEPEYWDTVMVSQVATKKNFDIQGLRVSEASHKRGKDVFDYIFDLLIEEKTEVEAIYFCMNGDNMDRVLTKEYVMVGSDAGARTIGGPLGIGRPHPRTFGTFPRFFQDFVFGRKIFTMQEAVRKTSTAACERFGIKNRGKLMEGFHADIVMLDPDAIADTSTYENPLSYPKGIRNVWVNGNLTVSNGEYSGKLSGTGLKIN
ncbi:MAG: amidohydrolase family protein, partial [Nitrospinota bacterium]|nr:amidohydrolase family protein [Nitrospinota bacterium]